MNDSLPHQILADLIRDSGHTINEGMDALQDANIISDNCIILEDIANEDVMRAIDWFRKGQRK